MQPGFFSPGRRGITVLTLLLIIVAVMLLAFFFVSYLRTRPTQAHAGAVTPLAHQPLDELNLPGVIQVVRRDPVDFLGVGPYSAG